MRTIQFSPNLHSSMERLKVQRAIFLWSEQPSFTFQYGEIKSLANYDRDKGYTHLHSSMERLKEAVCLPLRRLPGIYIPVWRD